MNTLLLSILIILILITILIVWTIIINNKAVLIEEDVNTFHNRIGMFVDQRYKTLKQGVSIMSEHNDNFKETYEKILNQRRSQTINYLDQEKEIKKTLKDLNVLVEKYPDIGEVFDSSKLFDNMKKIEADLFNIQDEYNEKANKYNSYIRVIPNNIILAGKKPYPYFEIKEEEIKEKSEYII